MVVVPPLEKREGDRDKQADTGRGEVALEGYKALFMNGMFAATPHNQQLHLSCCCHQQGLDLHLHALLCHT